MTTCIDRVRHALLAARSAAIEAEVTLAASYEPGDDGYEQVECARSLLAQIDDGLACLSTLAPEDPAP